jgi:type I restriction enzyme S subunit
MTIEGSKKVGDFVQLVRGTTYQGVLVGKPGPALLGLGSIIPGGGFRGRDFKTYGGTCPEKLMLRPGDLFVSLKGATKSGDMIGSIARVPPEVESGRLTQDTVKLVLSAEAEPLRSYLYWLLRTPDYRAYCAGRATGSAVVALSRDDFLSYPVPPLTQAGEAIVAVLDKIGDKIELNRRMNETLEAMARALFRDWFVDFGPTRAKMAGSGPYLSSDLWCHFPDRLDVDGKPEGWKVSTIGDEARVVGGSTPSTKEPDFWDGGINWATPKDLSNLAAPVLLETSRTITEAGLAKISSGLLPAGAVLLSSRAPIGYLAIAEVPVAINQGFIGMICDKRLSNVFAWLWTLENMEAILAKANGSTFQEISKGNFRPLPVVLPKGAILEAFDALAKPIYRRIAQNEKESRTLAQTRDLLLPRLMSGELRVAEVEQMVEAAQ